MKESYREDIASRSGLNPYADGGNAVGVASVRGDAGQPLSSEIITLVCRSCNDMEKAISSVAHDDKQQEDLVESKNLSCEDILCTGIGRSRKISAVSRNRHGRDNREGQIL